MSERPLLLECPFWMRTRWGQWLATRVRFMSRLWKREMDAALEKQAEFERGLYRDLLLAALNKWVALGAKTQTPEVMFAWCAWRNAAELLHRRQEERAARRLEMPLALTGLPRLDDEAAFRELCGLPPKVSG